MGDYRKLRVWQVSDILAVEVYRATSSFPAAERFGLQSQVRRAAVSIPSNIAEGCGRNTAPQLRQFVRIALGSANELEYQLGLALRLGYLDDASAIRLTEAAQETKRMLVGLLRGAGPR